MEIFNNIYLDILNNEYNNLDNFFNKGIDLLLEKDIILEQKENIINKLLFIFPDDYKLYYYMGYIYKDTNLYKALTWFKLCYNKNPNYIENILDFTKLLFENKLYEYINFLNKDNLFDTFNDERILLLIINLQIKNNNLKEAEKKLLSILDNTSNNDLIKCKSCSSIAYIYNSLNNFNKAFMYLNYAYDYIIKNNFEYVIQIPIINDILFI